MIRAFRLLCCGVSGRVLGIAGLAAILFIVGCTTSGNGEAQLAVATLSGGLPAGSVSVGGGAYPSTTLSATGGTGPYTWAVTMGALPTGLTLSSSGVVTGSPTTAGAFPFTVTVTDSESPVHTASASLSITINPQLAISTTGTLTTIGEAGAVYPATALSATGGVGPLNWTTTPGSLPGGLTLSSAGSISGTISASATPGNFNFTAKVTDSQGNMVTSGTLTLKVDPALTITPPTFPTGVVGVSYPAETFTAIGGSGTGYTFALASGTLPSPLTLGASGTIASGTPTTAGTSTFTVKVTDSLGYSSTTSSLSITINGPLAITPPTFPTGIVNASYPAETFTATGGSGTGYTFTLASGSLPTPLTLGANGTIASATPATAGNSTFTVKVTDSFGDAATTSSLSITIDPALVITPPALPIGVVGAAYPTKTFSASGGSGAGYTFTLASGTLPTPLTLGANGTIASGTPTTAGTYTFTVKVTDSLGFTTTSGSLIIAVDPALMITPPTLPIGVVGSTYPAETFTASGGSGTGYTFTLASGSLPSPLTLGANGTIASGMPTTAGVYTFTVKVTDSLGFATTSGTLSITINGPLAITPPTFPVGIVGGMYPAETFTAGGGSGSGYTFTLASGSLPTPLTLGANGTIASGTPTTAGTSTFTVKVTDSLGNTATTTSLSITIDPALAITPPTFPTGIINTSYPSETFTASGGSGSGYTFALASGSLPSPLTLGANGTIASATPTVSGTFNFTVRVTDSQGFTTTTGQLSITINAALSITPPILPSGVVNATYPSETFTASGGSGSGYTFTLASGSLPTPLTLGANGTITSATPTTAGTYTFTVKVTDSLGNTATTGSLSIIINLSLAITPPTFPTGIVGSSYPTETFTATGGSGSGYTFTLATGSLPTPLTLGANGTIASATPTTAGTYTFTVKVTDSSANTATTTSLSITINPALVITPPTFPTGIVNVSYPAETFTASGGSGSGYTFTLATGSLPSPLTLGANGTIASATPTTAGTYTFTVKVTDSLGFTKTTGNLSITINAALAIMPPTFPTGIVGGIYPAETFTASGGSGTGYAFTLASGSLPAPLSLGANGTIASGTPTTAGTSTFTVKVTDSLGNTATTTSLSITIDPTLVITPPTFLTGIINTSYPSETFTASGGSGSGFTFTLASGSLPTPLALGANGTIASATPTVSGTFNFTVRVTDSQGFTTTTGQLSITINAALTITPPTLPSGTINTAYNSPAFTASGGSGSGYVFTVASGSLAPLTLGSSTGIISGTPTSTGTLQFTVKVTDSLGDTATTGQLSITINPSCTNNCTLSGTVTGAWGAFVKISLSGTATASTTTALDGTYSFTNLTAGSYTITPSLTGYTYIPAAPVVNISGNTVLNFTATSVMTSYSISGTVTGSSAAGIVYIRVLNCGGGTNCNSTAGTTIPSIATNGGAFTVRGLSPGNNYTVTAEIDTLGTGATNEANPSGSVAGIVINSANVTGVTIPIAAPSVITAVTPNKPSVFPGNGSAFISYKQPSDGNGKEIATSYNVYYSTDSTFATGTTIKSIPAGDANNVYVLSGLTNTVAYYFKMTAVNVHGESTSPAPITVGPITIGALNTGFTFSGTVTFTGITPPAGSALYVGMFSGNNGVFFERIANPSVSQAFSVSGMTTGTYQEFAVLDVAGTGFVGVGDVTNFGSNGPPSVAVNSSTSGNPIALTAVNARTFISTSHTLFAGVNTYSISLSSDVGTKRPASMTLFSGNNVAVPFDMVAERHNNFQPIFNNNARPLTTDSYGILVSFSDGVTAPQNIPVTVGTVLDTFATNLQMNTPVNSTSITPTTVPMLNWSAPSPLPTFPYSYSVGLNEPMGPEFWNDNGGNNSNGIPSTQLNDMFGSGNNPANPNPSLTPGTTYDWWVTVQDDNGNQAQFMTTYRVPGGVGPAAKLVFTQQPGNSTAGSTIPQVQVAIEDASNNIVTTATNQITLSILSNPGIGALSGGGPVSPVNGVATFSNLSINNPGTGYTLSATSSPTLTNPASSAFNVAGAATQLVFIAQPTNTTTNTLITPPVQVAIEDASGRVVTNATNLITISLAGSGILSGGGAASPFNGVATFSNLSIDTAGTNDTLSASSSPALNTPSSVAFSVTAGPVTISSTTASSQFFFAGDPATIISITVANDVPGDVIQVALSMDANTTFNCTTIVCGQLPTGTLTANATFVSLVNGLGTYTISYTPPKSTDVTYQVIPTIVLTSNQAVYNGLTDFLEVDPAGILVTTDDSNNQSNEASTVNRGGTLTQIGSGIPITVTVRVYHDTTNAGVTFLPLTGSGYACANIGTNTCGILGTITGPVLSGTTSTTTITYTPPASLPAAPYDKPRIQAVSNFDKTRSGSFLFVLNSNPVTNMKFNYNTKFKSVQTDPAATVQTQTVIVKLTGDTGVSKTINWTLTANGAPCGSACGTLGTATTTVAANGTTVRSVITYTPPTSVPTGAGQTQPTLTATSADDGTQNDSFSFTISDGTCGTGNEALLKGQYAFQLRGGAGPGGYLALIGSFTADGAGKITAGTLDGNTSGFGPTLGLTILSAPMGSLPASKYSVGADNRGCLLLSDTGGTTSIFRFALGTLTGPVGSQVATEGRIIRFDDNTWRGRSQSGVLMKQDPTSFNAGALNGTYAFGIVGVDSNGGRNAGAGVFTANGAGTLSNLSEDFDGVNGPTGVLTGSGSSTMTASGRGTATVTITVTGGTSTSHSVLYMVSSSEILLMTTDTLGSNIPILSGEVKKQTGPFTQTPLNGNSYIFSTEGLSNSDGSNQATMGHVTLTTSGSTTNGSFSAVIDDNGNPESTPTGTTLIGTNGRMTLPTGGGSNPPIFYFVNSSSAFIVDTSSSVAFGSFEQQTGPFGTASITGPFFFGADAPTTGSSYASGAATFTPATGVIAGTEDSSRTDGLRPNNPISNNGGAAVTYCFAPSACTPVTTATGQGNVGGSLAYIISGSKLIFMDTSNQNGGTGPVNRNFVVIQK